jgi:hypothetical protein
VINHRNPAAISLLPAVIDCYLIIPPQAQGG